MIYYVKHNACYRNGLISFLVVSFLSIALVGFAQEVKTPRVIPPSPDATSNGKFGDIPLST